MVKVGVTITSCLCYECDWTIYSTNYPGRRKINEQLGGIFSKPYHNDEKRSNDILHKPGKIESHVTSSTLLSLLSGYSENIDFNIVTPCFSNISAIPKITLIPKKGEESQIITTSPYIKSLFKSFKISKKIRIVKTAKLEEQKVENKSALGIG